MEDLKSVPESTLIKAYLKIRNNKNDIKTRHKTELSPLNKGLDSIEAEFLRRLNESGLQSLSSKEGVAYRSERRSASCADRKEFLDYCVEGNHWDLMDYKPNVTAVTAFAEEHDGELPPGVKISRQLIVNVQTK